MRTIKQLPIAQDGNDTLFPDGQIRNETDTVTGTPVVREVYGDVLTNIYAIMRDAGLVPNGNEDSETSGYQLLQALKQFANEINDVNQVVTVLGTDITVGFDVSVLPNKYIFTGILTNGLNAGITYSINGLIDLTPVNNFTPSTQVVVILDTSGAKIYALGNDEGVTDIHIPFRYPLSFNNTNQAFYLSNGRLLEDTPKGYNTQSEIRTVSGNSNLNLIDAIIINGILLMLCVDTDNGTYYAYSALAANNPVTTPSTAGIDYNVYMFCDGDFVYFSNSDASGINTTDKDYSFSKYTYNHSTLSLDFVSSFEIDTDFEKTTNYCIKNDSIYTLINGNFYRYLLNGSTRSLVTNLNALNGIIFTLNNNVYFSSGDTAKNWNV